jgi:CRP-like cAMP-binding protein
MEALRFVGPYERALFMRTLAPLDELNADELATFAEIAKERRFRAGEALFRAGEPVNAVHVVMEGSVRAVGAELRMPAVAGPRDSVGFLAMLAHGPGGMEAIALEDTLTLELDREHFIEQLEESFLTFEHVVRKLARLTLESRREVPDGAYLAPGEGVPPFWPGRTTDLVERILLVRRPSAPFEKTSLDAVVDLSRFSHEVRLPAGATIWTAGDRGNDAYMILAGRVLCTTRGNQTRFRCGVGYPLGNLERLCDEPRWYTAVCETEVVAFRSEADSFYDMVEDHPDMGSQFVSIMAQNLIRLLSTPAVAAP